MVQAEYLTKQVVKPVRSIFCVGHVHFLIKGICSIQIFRQFRVVSLNETLIALTNTVSAYVGLTTANTKVPVESGEGQGVPCRCIVTVWSSSVRPGRNF